MLGSSDACHHPNDLNYGNFLYHKLRLHVLVFLVPHVLTSILTTPDKVTKVTKEMYLT
jgi:hypothetical protein